MDRLGAGFFRHVQNDIAAQIRIGRTRATDRPRLVSQPNVLRIAVSLRIHRDGMDAEAAAGADHPAGDLTTVGNQYALEHAVSLS